MMGARVLDRGTGGDLAAALARRGQPFWFVAHGASMAPSILSGTSLHVVPCSPDGLRAGMVVMARGRDGLVVHRLAMHGATPVLWGDAMAAPDGPLHEFEVIGRVDSVRMLTMSGRVLRRVRAMWSTFRRLLGHRAAEDER